MLQMLARLSRRRRHDLIYVPLLKEGTETWRRVAARPVQFGQFVVTGKNPDPDVEQWAFPTGSLVRVAPKSLPGGRFGLVAYERVDSGLAEQRLVRKRDQRDIASHPMK